MGVILLTFSRGDLLKIAPTLKTMKINLYFLVSHSLSSETYSAPCPGGCLDGGAG